MSLNVVASARLAPSAWLGPLVLVFVLAQGCALGGGERRTGGSGLSQAAEEAKKEPEEKHKKLEAGRPVEEDKDEDESETVVIVDRDEPRVPPAPTAISISEPDRPPAPRSIYRRFHLGAVGGLGMVTGDNFGGYGAGGLQVGFFPAPRWRTDLQLLGIGTNLSETSGLRQSFKGEHEVALDVSGRYYLTRENTFVGAYPIVGFRFGSLNWDYAHPILVEENGIRRVTSDQLYYYSPYVGVGTSLVQTRHFHLGTQLIGGGRFYERHTREGFANDLFNDGGFMQLMFEMTVPF